MQTEKKVVEVMRQLEFNFEVAMCPATETCGCGGDHGCGTVCAIASDGEHCPRCDSHLHHERACSVCRTCGYKSCGSE